MMYDLFTIHVWMALAGGAVGGISSFYDNDEVKRPIGEIITDFLISVIAAVSSTSYLLDPDQFGPFIFLGVGTFAGASARIVMSISKQALPSFLKSKMDGFLSSIATAIINSQKSKEKQDVNKE